MLTQCAFEGERGEVQAAVALTEARPSETEEVKEAALSLMLSMADSTKPTCFVEVLPPVDPLAPLATYTSACTDEPVVFVDALLPGLTLMTVSCRDGS